MNKKMIEGHLAQAERHVTLGENHITRQRELIVQLHRDALDIAEAAQLLVQFRELQALHVADRDRLRKQLRDGQFS